MTSPLLLSSDSPVVSTDLAAPPPPVNRDNCTTGFSSGSKPEAVAGGSSLSVVAPGSLAPAEPGVPPKKRTVFIPMDPYDPHCENGWNVVLKDDEEACPACTEHRCVDEYFERWCDRCQSAGIVKVGYEEF